MSWNSYIDSLVAASSDNCDKVAIIGLDGGAPWTTNDHDKCIRITAQEAAAIALAMTNDDFSGFQQSGLKVEGLKYQFLRKDDNAIYAKMKDNGSFTIQKTKTAIVIAHTGEGMQAGSTNKAVDTICNYLESLNM